MKTFNVPLLDWRTVEFATVTVQAVTVEEAWDKAAEIGERDHSDDFICVDQMGTTEAARV